MPDKKALNHCVTTSNRIKITKRLPQHVGEKKRILSIKNNTNIVPERSALFHDVRVYIA